MKEKVEEEKELPPIFKRQRYDVEPEVSAFDDEANTNFNTFLFNWRKYLIKIITFKRYSRVKIITKLNIKADIRRGSS